MKLAAKLILIFMLGVFAIVMVFSWQTVELGRQWAEHQHEENAHDLVEALKPSIAQAYRDGGVVRLQETIEVTRRSTNGPTLRWVDPRDPQSDFPNEPSESSMQVQSRRTSTLSIFDANGGTTFHTVVPLNIDGTSGAVDVAKSTSIYNLHLRKSILASLVSLLAVAGLSAAVILWGGMRLVGRPLQQLIGQVEAIGDGELDQPPALRRSDELGQLALAISHMSRRLSEQRETIRKETEARVTTEKQLRHADRLGTLGSLSAGVAHELGTPLNVVAGRAGLILSGKLTPDEITASAHTIKSEAERMTNIVRQLLNFARPTSQQSEDVNMNELVSHTCDLMRPLGKKTEVRVSVGEMPDPPLLVKGDPTQLQQVFTNLINNAVQAMPDGGEVKLSVVRHSLENDAGDYVCVSVADQGVGMNSETSDRAFEPFFTTKDVGEGTGLGLSIAYGIVREHAGWINLNSTLGEGTTFQVFLPCISPNVAGTEVNHA